MPVDFLRLAANGTDMVSRAPDLEESTSIEAYCSRVCCRMSYSNEQDEIFVNMICVRCSTQGECNSSLPCAIQPLL